MIRFLYPASRRRHLRNIHPKYIDEEDLGAALTDITEESHKLANETLQVNHPAASLPSLEINPNNTSFNELPHSIPNVTTITSTTFSIPQLSPPNNLPPTLPEQPSYLTLSTSDPTFSAKPLSEAHESSSRRGHIPDSSVSVGQDHFTHHPSYESEESNTAYAYPMQINIGEEKAAITHGYCNNTNGSTGDDRLGFHVDGELGGYGYYSNGIGNRVDASGRLSEGHHASNGYGGNGGGMGTFGFNGQRHYASNGYGGNGGGMGIFGFNGERYYASNGYSGNGGGMGTFGFNSEGHRASNGYSGNGGGMGTFGFNGERYYASNGYSGNGGGMGTFGFNSEGHRASNGYSGNGGGMGTFGFNREGHHAWNRYGANDGGMGTFGFNPHGWNGHNNGNVGTGVVDAFGVRDQAGSQIVELEGTRLGEGLSWSAFLFDS